MVTGVPPFFSDDKQELKRRILGIDPSQVALRFPPSCWLGCGLGPHPNPSPHPAQVSLLFPPDVPASCRMLLAQLFVRDPKHRRANHNPNPNPNPNRNTLTP